MRDWRIYADFAHHLIGIARKLYQKEPLAVEWIEVKTINIINEGSIETALPVENYSAAVSIYGKSTVEEIFAIEKDKITDIGTVSF